MARCVGVVERVDCIFCKIVAGEVPVDMVAESEAAVAFRDRSPAAPTHVLVIPRKHIASIAELTPEDAPTVSALLQLCAEVARSEGIVESGYRVLTNVGEDSGQTVFHVHFHVIGGRRLGEMG